MPSKDSDTFYELQTATGWGRTLAGFAKWCQAQSGWRVLDVGCGPGILSTLFSRQGCYAVGIDFDFAMFEPQPVHPIVVCANAMTLPFESSVFHLVTASNLLFLAPDPLTILSEIRRVTRQGGQTCLLNPSEQLTQNAAQKLADARSLDGLARWSLLNWAARAESNVRWTEAETDRLFFQAGFKLLETTLKVGPGFARFARASV